MRYYAGLDVSMKTVALCVEDQEGNIVFEKQVSTEPDDIAKALQPYADSLVSVGLESGSLCHWLTKSLINLGLPAICIDARYMAATLATQRSKTDKNDARGIAKAMRCQLYREVYVKSDESLALKSLLEVRSCLVNQKVQLSNMIRGLLKSFGIRLGPGQGVDFRERVNEIAKDLPIAMQAAILSLLEPLETLAKEIAHLTKQVQKEVRQDERAKLLMTVPGVGPIVAAAYLAEMDDPKRFKESSTVGAYVGMTPRQYQSGEVNRYGGITKAGPPYLRSLLTEAAIVLLTRTNSWSRLKSWGMKLAAKKGLMKAAVAVGRKLSVIMHRMLVTGSPFEYKNQKSAVA